MRKLRSFAATAAGLMIASSGAMADAPPTTATALAQSIDLSDAQGAGLVIVSLMVGAGVVLWGARLVMSKFKPKI